MLKPAIMYKEEIEQQFGTILYTSAMFYFNGYYPCNATPKIGTNNNCFQYAIVSKEDFYKKIIGYFSYKIDPYSSTAYGFDLVSFNPGDVIVGKDVFTKMEELVKQYHRIEWRMIGGNPVKKSYDRFCKKHNGRCLELIDAVKDMQGNYVNCYIYEIITNNR